MTYFVCTIRAFISVLLFTFFVGQAADLQLETEEHKWLTLFFRSVGLVRSRYIEEKSVQELISSALKGMLNGLDPHSTYITPQDYERSSQNRKGAFGGLGLRFLIKSDHLVHVVSVNKDSPAEESGLKEGDRIIAIDKVDVQPLPPKSVVKMLRGKPGSKVRLTVLRGAAHQKPFDIEATRKIIHVIAVESKVFRDVGYLRIIDFTSRLEKDARQALKKLQNDKNIKSLVIDLRNNPGGLLDQAVNLADFFLDAKKVAVIHGRDFDKVLMTRKGEMFKGYPIIVLVNGSSASASEVFAGAMQDHKRALLVGEHTFGKGVIQSILELPDHQGGISLTVARYYTPLGRIIQKKGLEPDIWIPKVTVSVDTKQVMREKDMVNAPTEIKEDSSHLIPASDQAVNQVLVKDYQLWRAVDAARLLVVAKTRP